AGAALRTLLQLGAKEGAVLRDGTEALIPTAEPAAGEELVVRPGETIATAGTVISGARPVDQSLLTGAPRPLAVAAGDGGTGATVNEGGRLVVRAERVGSDTELARMARLVDDAQSGKAEIQRLADRVSAVFVPIVFLIAALTVIGWLIAGGGAVMA